MGEHGEISQDGNWRWDGTQWQPIEQVDQSNDGDNSSPQLEEKATPVQDSDLNPTRSSVEQKEVNEEKESPDKMLTILAIGVLVFSAITGIMAQKFTMIDEEATSFEVKANELDAEARSLETIENQVLLREEILLTEVKTLLLENDLAQDDLDSLTVSLSEMEADYFAEFDSYELFAYFYYSADSEFLSEYCFDQAPYCAYSEGVSDAYGLGSETFTFTLGSDADMDERLNAMDGLTKDYYTDGIGSDAAYKIQFESTQNEFIITMPYYYDLYLEDYSSIYWYIYDLDLTKTIHEDDIAGLENSKSNEEANLSAHLLNRDLAIANANTCEIIGELYYNDGDTATADVYFTARNENITEANELLAFAESAQNNITLIDNQIYLAKQDLSLLEERINEIGKINFDRFETEQIEELQDIESRYLSAVDEMEMVENSMEKSNDLVERLLVQSRAYAEGTLDETTGEYSSEDAQLGFYELIHENSGTKYNDSDAEQQKADEIREDLSELSTSVMLVSVGNVILGITSGMVTKAKQGNGNKRNILILLGAGAITGSLGALQSIGILF